MKSNIRLIKYFLVSCTRDIVEKTLYSKYWLVVSWCCNIWNGVWTSSILLHQCRRNVSRDTSQTAETQIHCFCWNAKFSFKNPRKKSRKSSWSCSRWMVTNSKSFFLSTNQLFRFASQEISTGFYSRSGKRIFFERHFRVIDGSFFGDMTDNVSGKWLHYNWEKKSNDDRIWMDIWLWKSD